MSPHVKMSRREFIRAVFTSAVVAAAYAAAARDPFAILAASRKKEWAAPDEARIGFASGRVLVNGRESSAGDPVRAGDVVETGPGSETDIEIRDYSVFHLKEDSSVRVSDILVRPAVEVRKGWFLIIVKKGTPLEIRTPAVLAGVRGTVVFFKILDEERAYLCNCNGKIELANPETGDIIRSVTSGYHTAFYVKRARAAVDFKRAGLLYHSDGDILRMADRFRRETRVFRNAQESGTYAGY